MILIGGLHHVPNYARNVVLNLSKAVKTGGYFVSFEPTHNHILVKKIRNFIYSKNPLFDYETERDFHLNELNDFYHDADFRIVDQIYPGLLSYILYYNPDAFPILNLGGGWLVKILFTLDTIFFRGLIGRKLSFATLSLLKKI